jgi:rod shape-determining protein MreB
VGFFSRWSSDLAIDLGTANTVIYVKGKGIVINEPSVIAINKKTGVVLAVGNEAKKMLGRNPISIETVRPLKDGKISNAKKTEEMLKHFIKLAHSKRMLIQPRIIISVPTGITDAERQIVESAGRTAGAREVYLVEEPLAAAVGAGLPIHEAGGSMIVDIGGGTTEVGLISLSEIVTSYSGIVGGDKMNEAIMRYIKSNRNLQIGENRAEQIKIELGTAVETEEIKEAQIKGFDTVSRLPKIITINSDEILDALKKTVNEIIDAIIKVLDEAPPELAGDIAERGIVITGGGSLLRGLDKVIRERTGVPVSIADNPLLSVVRGGGIMLENIDKYVKV